MKRITITIATAMLLWSNAAFTQDKPAFVFTAIPDQDETRLVERFTRVADYLQGKLGVSVKYLPVKNYPAAVTAFTNSQVQLA
jgi:phosphonate transport system substrate-binding protein